MLHSIENWFYSDEWVSNIEAIYPNNEEEDPSQPKCSVYIKGEESYYKFEMSAEDFARYTNNILYQQRADECLDITKCISFLVKTVRDAWHG